MSWQHLTFVSLLMVAMIALAVILGLQNKRKDSKAKNKVLIYTAILIDALEIFKIVIFCLRSDTPLSTLSHLLPLFLCSIQLITIPLAAFSRGRIKEAALDFVLIFGILGAVLGTFGATQNYDAYPVLCIDNVVSELTHSISGFASLYIAIAGMASMKKKNIFITFSILFGFCLTAFVTNYLVDYNYMFLRSHDGTPYQIVHYLVNGSPVLYPIAVVLLFILYISAYYFVFFLFSRKKSKKAQLEGAL